MIKKLKCVLWLVGFSWVVLPLEAALQLTPVDVHERLFLDRPASGSSAAAIHVPRGAPVVFQFALRADTSGEATAKVSKIAGKAFSKSFAGQITLHALGSVHVEGNTQGNKTNCPGGAVPEGWMQYLVREAPYDTLEVLVPTQKIAVEQGRTHGLLLEISVPPDANPGVYKGTVTITLDREATSAPFQFQVHQTVLPQKETLHSIHWLWPEPHNLTRGTVPGWWSERHWQLLENSAKQLRRFGDDTLYTPLVNYKEPLIQIRARRDGSFEFDYTRFDRWITTFQKFGYRYFAGHHILNLPSVHAGGVFYKDEATDALKPLFRFDQREEWLNFLPIFYDSLHSHLARKGWTDLFLLHQYDEPHDAELYQRLAALSRKHLHGIRTLDAINSTRQNVFSPLVDVQVFNLPGIVRYQSLVAERREREQRSWLYHCTSPYPPNPNRHLDSLLTESRLYPWLCFKFGATGYLFWGANIYRGADEYKTSIGPFPNGSQNPGHPPGDNWFFYRSADGLLPSMRMVSFREGLIDHSLLTLLRAKHPEKADVLVERIARSSVDFERTPNPYHGSRREMLEWLDTEGIRGNSTSVMKVRE